MRFSKRIFATVLIVLPLISLTLAARTTTLKPTTTAKPNKTATATKATTNKDGISVRLDQNAGNSNRNSTRGKIITTRLGANGNPEEQCQCTLFYLCDQENVIEVQAGSGNECPDNSNVCCRIPLNSLTTDEPTLPSGNNGNANGNDNGNGYDNGNGNGNANNGNGNGNVDIGPVETSSQTQSTCTCVPFYQCQNYDSQVATAGAGLINPRFPCTGTDVCCPVDRVTSGGNTGGGGGGNEGNPSIPPSVPTYTDSTPTQTPFPPYVPPTGPTPSPEECGIRRASVDNRISAPEHLAQTSFGEFPWMALILTTEIAPNGTRTENVFVCGASLLSPSVVLTAAHCVNQIDFTLLRVRVGEYNTHQGATEPIIHQDRAVSRISIHTSFNNRVLFNDLALIRVAEDFVLAQHISPICTGFTNSLYAEPNSYNPAQCLATGWGKNAFGNIGNYQTTLKRVDLTIIPRDECQNRLRQTRLGQHFILDGSFVCAGGQAGFDTCQGDGGGPLVCASRDNPNRYIQVGVVSWGIGCASDIPGVYASLEANREWLTTEFNTMTVFRRGS